VINNKLFDGGCDGVGRSKHDCEGNSYSFGDSGFHKDFQDGDNQLFHLWGYIAQTYSNPAFVEFNTVIGIVGNVYHEIGQSVLNKDDGWGTSWNDYALSEAGMSIGTQLSRGEIFGYGLGDYLRKRLRDKDPVTGSPGPGSGGKVDTYMKRWGPLKGMDRYGN
jgi:hypothetical protein